MVTLWVEADGLRVAAAVGANLLLSGNTASLLTWATGVIPTLALGVWSGSPRLFEVVYVTLWYIGPLNDVPALNFINGPALAAATLVLFTVAVLGRQRQLRVL